MGKSALAIRNVSKKFGDIVALDLVSLDVGEGETFGLLGPNGAGKSTLINIMSGVLRRDGGEIEFLGQPLREPTVEFKLNMGVIPQEISLYSKLTAKENLEFYGRLYGLDSSTLRSRIKETLELVGLTDRQNDRIETYSGGMKRRINIAASILHSPRFILMDEPTVGIDPQSRNLIFEVIEKLHGEGVTIVYTSHYMEEVERLCQGIAIIDHGKVIASGTKSDLIALIGELDLVEIEIEGLEASQEEAIRCGLADMDPTFSDGTLILRTADGSGKLGGVIGFLTEKKAIVRRVTVKEPDLESVFLHLTGKELRD